MLADSEVMEFENHVSGVSMPCSEESKKTEFTVLKMSSPALKERVGIVLSCLDSGANYVLAFSYYLIVPIARIVWVD
ncbi:hypothetical protein Leryth_009762 [Lithospermum erythrorhizon]|nr:hypothetical protein Leryth_009762 [Lithospermum erythrorhizon]